MKLQTIKCKTCNKVFAACKADYIDAEWTAECDRYVKEGNSIVEIVEPLKGENVFGDDPLNPCCGKPALTGIELIAQERQRQIEVEGWTAEHDAEHKEGELANAACAYAMTNDMVSFIDDQWGNDMWLYFWPFELDWLKKDPTDEPDQRIKDLAKAGALIAAEIDRINALKGGSSE